MNTLFRAILSAFGLLGWIELCAALVVAIGCAGEFWIIVNKLTMRVDSIGKNAGVFWCALAWIDLKIRPLLVNLKINRRKLPEAREHLLERFFVLLVALGVSVEFVALPFSMREIAELNTEAAHANERAGHAEKLAGEAKMQAAKANENAAFLTQSNLLLQKEILLLRAATEDRKITKEQKDKLEIMLKDVRRMPFVIYAEMSVKDSELLARSLTDTLISLGFQWCGTQRAPVTSTGVVRGIVVLGEESSKAEVPIFIKALETIGFTSGQFSRSGAVISGGPEMILKCKPEISFQVGHR